MPDTEIVLPRRLHPRAGAALYAALRGQDRRGEVRRPRHGRPQGCGQSLCARHRAAQAVARSIRSWFTAAGRRSASMLKKMGIEIQVRGRAARHRRADDGNRRDGPRRLDQQGNRRARSMPRASGRSGSAARTATWSSPRRPTKTVKDPGSNIERVLDLGLRRRAGRGRPHAARPPRPLRDDPGDRAGRAGPRRQRPTISMPTPLPAPSPARSAPSACCSSPTSTACSTRTRS